MLHNRADQQSAQASYLRRIETEDQRKISEREGFWVYLAPWLHNQSNQGVHGKDGHELDMMLKKHCQMAYEKQHSREEFMALIGKNYLD